MPHLDVTINGVRCFVIFNGNFLLATIQFLPPEAANSQFWLRSRTHKLCPHATTLPKPSGRSIIQVLQLDLGLLDLAMLLHEEDM
jgi:hypothetical protein